MSRLRGTNYLHQKAHALILYMKTRRTSTSFVKLFVSSVRWHFFVFRNSVEKFCVSWAFPLIECVAVWALKPPVPHTDVLKTHSSQSFSTELLEYKGTGSEHLSQTNPSKLSFSLSYKRIPKYLSGCGCCIH